MIQDTFFNVLVSKNNNFLKKIYILLKSLKKIFLKKRNLHQFYTYAKEFNIYTKNFLFSCSRLPESKGEFNEIIIITSEQDKDIIYDDVNEIFGEVINTPSEEPIYSIKWIEDMQYLNTIHYKKYIVLIKIIHLIQQLINLLVNLKTITNKMLI